MPINLVKVKKNSISEESVITESIATDSKITDSTLTESSSAKGKKKTKTQAQKKETKSVELAPKIEQKELNQEEIKFNPEILPETETKDLEKKKTKTQAKKKEAKGVELISIAEKMEEINLNQEIPPEIVLSEAVPIVESQPAKTKKKTKKAKVSSESSEAPIAENQPQTPNPEEAEQKSPIFQAFGLVQGKILEQGSFYVLQIGEQTYPLYGSKERLKSFSKREEDVYLRVYPNWKPNVQKEEVLGHLNFTVVAVLAQCPKKYQVNHFKVRGIWQKVPFLAEPVITVYRNQSRGVQDDCRALHFPLIWKDAPVEAFEYNPNVKGKQDYTKRYFCQVEAIFSAETQEFTVSSLLEEPTTTIPPYIKPQKSPKPPKVETSSQPKPPIILKKKAEESLEIG